MAKFEMFSEDYFWNNCMRLHGLKNYPKHIQDRVNDNLERQRIEDEKDPPEYITEPVKIPMPFIEGDPNVKGPLLITKDWYVKEKKKKIATVAKQKKELQIEMMELLARRDVIRGKLARLNPYDPKDASKIVKFNIELKDIKVQLDYMSQQTGVNITELDHGTRFSRKINEFKRRVTKKIKKVKEFFSNNMEAIVKVTIGVLPIVIGIASKLFGKESPVPAN